MLVLEYLPLVAATLVRRVVVVSARAGIHRRDEHEARREIERSRRTRDGNMTILKRLAKDFEGGARKLCELVEKEDATMRERDFAGDRFGSATKKTD